MAEKGGEKPKIFIIKKKKKGHGGHHGGSWKVAYADFVTAMMALFLLLWLISMVSPDRKVVLADFFKHFSVFEHGQSFMPGTESVLKETGLGTSQKNIRVKGMYEAPAEMLKEKLEKEIKEKLKGLKEQILVEITDSGLKIQIVDMAGKPIFDLGSDSLTSRGRDILKVVSENLKDIPNQIIIEGHTDSSPFKGGMITNWELSTDRASAARRELEGNGLDPGRFAKIVGMSDRDPLIKDDLFDPRNRRISLLVIPETPKPEAEGAKSFSIIPTEPAPSAPQPAPEPEKIVPIDRSKIIGDMGLPSRGGKPDFLKE
ncbi:MAG: OmpA family protein [Nitrospinae bacterium]|nr:OmpA family protein [Nitrospinota bacterium]